jgi:hypothetical protein
MAFAYCVHHYEYDTSGRGTLIRASGRNTPVPERFKVQSYPLHVSIPYLHE